MFGRCIFVPSITTQTTTAMKISGKQIEAGMTIAVASIGDNKEMYMGFASSPNLSQADRDRYTFLIENNMTKSVKLGSIKKSSPVLKVEKVEFSQSCSYYVNSRKVTLNSIFLHTDKGIIEIGHGQKVEVK